MDLERGSACEFWDERRVISESATDVTAGRGHRVFYAFSTTSFSDVACILPNTTCQENRKKKEKKPIKCNLDPGNEVHYHHFTVSTLTHYDRFILALQKSKFG